MIVRQIISGGQSGVERAALDLAIQLGISHGGWVAPGRLVDDGLLSGQYRLREMAFPDGPSSAAANLEMADGILVMTRGGLSGEAADLYDQAQAHHHPHLLIDFDRNTRFQSSLLINSWLKAKQVEILFITGARETEKPGIYRDTMDCFRTAWWALLMAEPVAPGKKDAARDDMPRTLDEAVNRLLGELPLKDRVTIANMSTDEITGLGRTLGRYVQKRFGLWEGNRDLEQSCLQAANRKHLGEEEIAALIIDRLARELQKTHTLRVL